MKLLLLLSTLFFFGSIHCQNELELKGFTETQVDSVWQSIFESDQNHRTEKTVDSIDNLNFKKTIILIQEYGYPEGNITPNVVFVHQRSNFVCEYYFPIFREAFVAAKADTFWFMHNVRRLHRGRFNQDFVQPNEANYEEVLDRMAPFLNLNVDYSVEPFDSLFTSYIDVMDNMALNPKVGHWHTDFYGDYQLVIYKVGDKLFLENKRERSVILPQEVLYNETTKSYKYVYDCCGIEFRVDKEGNIAEYFEGVEKKLFVPIGNPISGN